MLPVGGSLVIAVLVVGAATLLVPLAAKRPAPKQRRTIAGCNRDLGLVYGIGIEGGHVDVTMTMTTPGCPAQDYIVGGVESRLAEEPGVTGAFVTVAWDPPWSPQRMSAEAKAHFRIREDTE